MKKSIFASNLVDLYTDAEILITLYTNSIKIPTLYPPVNGVKYYRNNKYQNQ
jgi:hypothetical protein